jgi:hypothetical protein
MKFCLSKSPIIMLSNILLIKIWHLTCKKNLQFVAILYLLTHGKLMSDFENMGFLLDLLKIKHCHIKIWCINIWWVMVKVFHTIIMKVPSLHWINKAIFLLCLVMKLFQSLHAFTIYNRAKVPMLLSLEL